MHIPDMFLPFGLVLTGYLLWPIILLQAVRYGPWRQLYANRPIPWLLLTAVVLLLLLWRLEASVAPGLGFHFLGVTVLTLTFGWSLAVVVVSLVAVVSFGSNLQGLALNTLVMGVLPVSISYGIYFIVHRFLPRHVFIYIFLCAFFGSVIAVALTLFTLMAILIATDAYSGSRIGEVYLPFLPLYLFPEALLNGMLVTVLIGLRPHWLKTFDEKSYLGTSE